MLGGYRNVPRQKLQRPNFIFWSLVHQDGNHKQSLSHVWRNLGTPQEIRGPRRTSDHNVGGINMKKFLLKFLLAIVSAPLAIVLIAFDFIKLPLVLVILGLFAFIQMLNGSYERGDFWCVTKLMLFLGTGLYLAFVWNYDYNE